MLVTFWEFIEDFVVIIHNFICYLFFNCTLFSDQMPTNKDLTQEDQLELENGGDVKPDTKRRRKKVLEDFSKYLTEKTGLDVEYFVSDKNNESSRDLFTETLSRYFWSYQVKVLKFCFGSKMHH